MTTAVVAVLTGAACNDSGADSDSDNDDVGVDLSLLGPEKPASGEPVKVGFVSDGATPVFDNTIQLDAAAAVTKFLNAHAGGIGGRPIELVTCESKADPARAADCANQFVQEDVVVTVAGETTAIGNMWQSLHDAGIPVFLFGTTEQSVILDPDSTFVLGDLIAGLGTLPITVAKDNDVPKVTVVGIDVPVVTGFYEAIGEQVFGDAGLELELVAIPPDQADMTPQMAQIAAGGPTEVHVIGGDAFCISAFNALRAVNFTGPISVVSQCVSDSSKTALGEAFDGVYTSTPFAVGDDQNEGMRQWRAIVETYDDNGIDPSNSMGPTIYFTMLALSRALDGISGDVTSAGITEKIKMAPELPLPAAPGLTFQCNGAANPLVPAACSRGALLTVLDADGEPTLPYRSFGTAE